jgi:hypothetical protein
MGTYVPLKQELVLNEVKKHFDNVITVNKRFDDGTTSEITLPCMLDTLERFTISAYDPPQLFLAHGAKIKNGVANLDSFDFYEYTGLTNIWEYDLTIPNRVKSPYVNMVTNAYQNKHFQVGNGTGTNYLIVSNTSNELTLADFATSETGNIVGRVVDITRYNDLGHTSFFNYPMTVFFAGQTQEQCNVVASYLHRIFGTYCTLNLFNTPYYVDESNLTMSEIGEYHLLLTLSFVVKDVSDHIDFYREVYKITDFNYVVT